MLTFDLNLETRFIKTVLTGQKHLFFKVDKSWFGSLETVEIVERLHNLHKNGKDIPTLITMADDPVLSDASKNLLKGNLPPLELHEISYASDLLDYYRKGRILLRGLTQAAADLSTNNPIIEDTVKNIQQTLVSLNSLKAEDAILTYGGTSEDVAKAMEFYTQEMNEDVTASYIRTGFKSIDDQQGGVARGGVYVIAANSGGGKSTWANNIAINMAKNAWASVGYLSLEMQKSLNLYRTQSNLCNIPHDKFLQKKLTPEERSKSDHVYAGFQEYLRKNGKRLDYYCLGGYGYDIHKALSFMEPMQHDAIIIDYVNLLEPLDKKRALWENIGEAVRVAKIYAEKYNKVVFILAQLDEDTGKLKYAKAIEHHADGVFAWILDKASRELGVVTIKQMKLRRGNPTEFNFALEFEFCRFKESYGMGAEPPATQTKTNTAPTMKFT